MRINAPINFTFIMKSTFLLLIVFLSLQISAQSPLGAWEKYHYNESGESLRSVTVFTDHYQVTTTYDIDTGEFIETKGGSWKLKGNKMIQTVEFDSDNPKLIGTEIRLEVAINDSIMEIVGSDIKMKRIDDGTPGALQGAWLMSGRTIDGKTQLRDTDTPRKTMKILSGTRFQWIAYNTETKEFMATGGGTYTTKDGKYTENIEFFSRDNSRVGLQLKFDYMITDGNWHHSGFSTKGDPIDEVWSLRK